MMITRNTSRSETLFVALLLATVPVQGCHLDGSRDQQLRDPRTAAAERAASDAIADYKLAKRDGHKVDTCRSAGKVAEAFLKASDEAQHKRWKRTEERDCKTIGFPF
jgi:hypothetical protein